MDTSDMLCKINKLTPTANDTKIMKYIVILQHDVLGMVCMYKIGNLIFNVLILELKHTLLEYTPCLNHYFLGGDLNISVNI